MPVILYRGLLSSWSSPSIESWWLCDGKCVFIIVITIFHGKLKNNDIFITKAHVFCPPRNCLWIDLQNFRMNGQIYCISGIFQSIIYECWNPSSKCVLYNMVIMQSILIYNAKVTNSWKDMKTFNKINSFYIGKILVVDISSDFITTPN